MSNAITTRARKFVFVTRCWRMSTSPSAIATIPTTTPAFVTYGRSSQHRRPMHPAELLSDRQTGKNHTRPTMKSNTPADSSDAARPSRRCQSVLYRSMKVAWSVGCLARTDIENGRDAIPLNPWPPRHAAHDGKQRAGDNVVEDVTSERRGASVYRIYGVRRGHEGYSIGRRVSVRRRSDSRPGGALAARRPALLNGTSHRLHRRNDVWLQYFAAHV